MRSKLWLAVGALLLSAACSETPLSPSATPVAPTSSGVPHLRWDVVATGCAPSPAPSPLPDERAARVAIEGDGSLRATWPIVSPTDRAGTLYARFLSYGSDWALCSWDTVDQ